MKKYWKIIPVFFLITAAACGDPSTATEQSTNDTMPVVKPDVVDTTSVITPPPTGDSNVVTPEN